MKKNLYLAFKSIAWIATLFAITATFVLLSGCSKVEKYEYSCAAERNTTNVQESILNDYFGCK